MSAYWHFFMLPFNCTRDHDSVVPVVGDLIGNCVDHAHYPSTVPHVIAKQFMHEGYRI